MYKKQAFARGVLLGKLGHGGNALRGKSFPIVYSQNLAAGEGKTALDGNPSTIAQLTVNEEPLLVEAFKFGTTNAAKKIMEKVKVKLGKIDALPPAVVDRTKGMKYVWLSFFFHLLVIEFYC